MQLRSSPPSLPLQPRANQVQRGQAFLSCNTPLQVQEENSTCRKVNIPFKRYSEKSSELQSVPMFKADFPL